MLDKVVGKVTTMCGPIKAKLNEVRAKYEELVAESEKAVTPQPEAFVHALNAFLEAGYSLRELLKKDKGYDWKAWKPESEQDLVTLMHKQRGSAVHHNGAPKMLVDWEEAFVDPPGKQKVHPAYSSQSFGPIGMQPARANRRNYRFKDDGKNVVETCKDYLAVLEKLVKAFP